MTKLTPTERRVLETLQQYGPKFNGTLASIVDVVWNSRVFKRMEKRGLIAGHPYKLTEAGRIALTTKQ